MILTRADAVPMSDLVAELGVEKSTLTRQIDALVRLGLAERRPDPQDARARLVALTDPGRGRLTESREAVIARWRDGCRDGIPRTSVSSRRCCGAWATAPTEAPLEY